MKLKDLAVKHDYYSSESNYTDKDAGEMYETMTAYLDNYENADVDMNLCFRWDVHEHTDDNDKGKGTYYAEVFMMHQRKGIYAPHHIRSITEDEVDRFVKYLELHSKTILNLWNPIIKLKD